MGTRFATKLSGTLCVEMFMRDKVVIGCDLSTWVVGVELDRPGVE
jgi:hypothetical protein